MSRVKQELAVIPRLAAPVVLAQVGWMMLGIVDTWFVGRLGPVPLAAVALGDLWAMATLLMAMGVLMGLDTLVSQAHGAGDGRAAAHALQRGLLLALALSLPLAGAWLSTGPVLRLLGQDPALAALAHGYVQVQVFGIPAYLVFVALRQYLQGRAIMFPSFVVVIAGNVVNAVLDWLLIFGHGGFPALGVRGSGLATGIARVVMLVVLFGLIRWFDLHRDAWVPWSREAFNPRGLRRLLALGLPVGLTLGLEMWAFAASGLLAGWLGSDALAAHTIVLKVASLTYMVPLGIAIASATRVGNLVGAGDPHGARRAAFVALSLGGGVMLVFAILFVLLRHAVPALFLAPGAAQVLALAAAIMPIAGAFQLFDGLQGVGGGVLRGLGRNRPAALFNFLGYYALGLPLGIWLAFGGPRLGLVGLWVGLALGLAAVAALSVMYIYRTRPGEPTGA
jgi:MATE family multidrug resistance protein